MQTQQNSAMLSTGIDKMVLFYVYACFLSSEIFPFDIWNIPLKNFATIFGSRSRISLVTIHKNLWGMRGLDWFFLEITHTNIIIKLSLSIFVQLLNLSENEYNILYCIEWTIKTDSYSQMKGKNTTK